METTNQVNATTLQEQEICRDFVRIIRKSYKKKGLYGIYFKMIGDYYHFRAKWNRRSLWGFSQDKEMAMAKFMLEISRKVFQEHYYPTEEFKRIKDKLQERIIMKYSIKIIKEPAA